MPLNTSGPISLGGATVGQSINLELSQPASSTVSLNDTNVRTLANIPAINTTITIPTDFYGKSLANAWFMTISSPTYSAVPANNFVTNLKIDSANNIIINWTNSPANACIASITQTGTVNWTNQLSSSYGPNFNTFGWGMADDLSNPSNIMIWGGTSLTPTTLGNRRGFIAKLNTSTGAISQYNLTRATSVAPTPAPAGDQTYITLQNYFPLANGNFIISAGANRNPPGQSNQMSAQLLNPSFTQILSMALPGIIPENITWNWRRFTHADPTKTGAVIAGPINFGEYVAGPPPIVAQATAIAHARINQDGTVSYIKRNPYQSYRTSGNDQFGYTFNDQDNSYNFFAYAHAMGNAYAFDSSIAGVYYKNNFINRINKTTGVVERTVTSMASPTTMDTFSWSGETYGGINTQIDPVGNFAKITASSVAATPTATTFNLRYFNINDPITNTYSAQWNPSSIAFVNIITGSSQNITTHNGYNYFILVNRTIVPMTIGILKVKSDGSWLSSGLNVTAPNGWNVQLNPISNSPLFTQSNVPFTDASFISSPQNNSPQGTATAILNTAPISVAQNIL